MIDINVDMIQSGPITVSINRFDGFSTVKIRWAEMPALAATITIFAPTQAGAEAIAKAFEFACSDKVEKQITAE